MESRDSSNLQITLLRYDIHIVAGLFVLQYIPDYLALTTDSHQPLSSGKNLLTEDSPNSDSHKPSPPKNSTFAGDDKYFGSPNPYYGIPLTPPLH